MDKVSWERARLFPVSGVGGADEQERRASSALLAVVESVREFGRALTVPLGAPSGRLSAYIEVQFKDGGKKLRPDGAIRVEYGRRSWTALVEVKTGRNNLIPEQIEAYLELARRHKFDVLLTISNQVVSVPGEHPVKVTGTKSQLARWHHVSWSQIRTEALMEQANKAVNDPDQAWILAEFIRYLGHPRSGAIDFDDMGPSWVHVRDRARTGTLHPQDKGVADVTDRFGRLVSFTAMRLSRELSVPVRPVLAPAQLRDPARYLQKAVTELATNGMMHGALRVPATVAPIKITADLRAALVRCAITVTAPREGRPTTRVNWLVRQLKSAPGQLSIEAATAWQRGPGPARTLDQARDDPHTLISDPTHELRTFTLTLTSNAGPARGQGHGSFVNSVLTAVDAFYAEVVQHLKPWAPAPPKVREDDAAPRSEPAAADGTPADRGQELPDRTDSSRPWPEIRTNGSPHDRESAGTNGVAEPITEKAEGPDLGSPASLWPTRRPDHHETHYTAEAG